MVHRHIGITSCTFSWI